MNLSSVFIHRPIATTLLAILLAISGVIAFQLLPISQLPQIEFPTIVVQASLPGASPEIMATSVAAPLEHQIGQISHITEMTSASSLGSTQVVIQFDLDRDIDGAARDVQAAINASLGQLPSNLPSNPTYRKVNPADAPIMILALTSDTYSKGQMYDVASTFLQQKLSQVDGVGQITVGGSSLPGVRVELNPAALNSYNISLESVRNALGAANANRPKGQLSNGFQTSEITTKDQLYEAHQYEPLIISYRNGSPVRISDVATVRNEVEDLRQAGISNGKPSVLIVLFKQPGANVIDSVDKVRSFIPELQASLQKDIHINVVMDRTTTIRASLKDIEFTLLLAVILVIFVVFYFLRSVRTTSIPAVAVPLSLLGTCGVMYLLGYSLDNLSLMAMTISTGFVVDDAIVVLENITRHMEQGMKPLHAAFYGAKEIGFTVVSMSISLIAVFIPILLMGGIVGRLFQEFAVTLSVAILVSLLVSLTVTPMMCSRILRPPDPAVEPRDDKNDFFERLRIRYDKSLQWSLSHSTSVLIFTLCVIAFNIFLFILIPKGFFPQQDTGRVMASIIADQHTSFQSMQQKLSDFVSIVKKDPAVENVVGFIGGSSTNTGSMFISLKPLDVRKLSADAIIGRLRKKLNKVTGAKLYMQSAQDLTIGGRQSGAQFQYALASDNLSDLHDWAQRVTKEMEEIPGIADINSNELDHGLQVHIDQDKATAARLGLSQHAIDSTLYDAFGQRQVSTMYKSTNQYHVVMEVAPQYWQRPSTLNDIYVGSSHGVQVPLSAFSKFSASSTFLKVNHQNQFPSITLSFNLLPNTALGQVVDQVKEKVEKMKLPPNVQGSFQGSAKAFQDSLANEPYLIAAALVVIYIVLGMLYENLIHPITILSTLPSAGVGALIALLLTHTDFSLMALIGIILLIGIVKKNAIMMIDCALTLQKEEQLSSYDSIYQAAKIRFRPIMMTTMAALLGAVPLAFGNGVGSELRKPLGISIIGGLIVSQMLTLYTTPVIYLFLERVRCAFKRVSRSAG